MKSTTIAATLIFLSSQVCVAQEEKAEPKGFDAVAMEQIWAAYATPGEHHKVLQNMVGEWKTETKEFMPNPDKPTTTTGTATFESILGGRFTQQKFSGMSNGQKFEGVGISGYDNHQKKYVAVWVDTMGTGMLHMDGKYNAKSKTMTETSDYESPVGTMKFRMETKEVNKDKYIITMYLKMNPQAPEMKTMSITYNRVK